jgi:hypothetical protein
MEPAVDRWGVWRHRDHQPVHSEAGDRGEGEKAHIETGGEGKRGTKKTILNMNVISKPLSICDLVEGTHIEWI